MALSYIETKELIDLVLKASREKSRHILATVLKEKNLNEPKFYASIIKHKPGLKLTSDQWFELLYRLPNKLLHSELESEKILSEAQLKRLPRLFG